MTKHIVARLRNYVAQFGVRAPNVVQPISEAADEINRLRAALQEISYLFLDAVQSDCENGVRSLNEKAYAKYLSDYPATLAAIHSMNGIIDDALAGGKTND